MPTSMQVLGLVLLEFSEWATVSFPLSLPTAARFMFELVPFNSATAFLFLSRWKHERKERLNRGSLHAYMKGSTMELTDRNSLAT